MRPLLALAGIAGLLQAQEPITVTSFDMFNATGQYYRAYVATNVDNVSTLLGQSGGPRAWNFSQGPTNYTARFDYVAPSESGLDALFPEATLAERKTVEETGKTSWLFLKQEPGTGRINYGFHDPDFSPDMPTSVFDPPIVDFPENITYGSSWSVSTEFLTSIGAPDIGFDIGLGGTALNALPAPQDDFGIPAKIIYSADSKADAYGYVTLPKLGFMECLRINELATYEIQIDFDFTGNYQTVGVYFVRSLYWLAKDRGIVAQVVSQQSGTPPSDAFSTAAVIMRQFENNHPEGSRDPLPVADLQITPGQDQVMLHWTPPLNAASFRVESTESLGDPSSWTLVTTTTNNFLIVPTEGPWRFFRIVSLP